MKLLILAIWVFWLAHLRSVKSEQVQCKYQDRSCECDEAYEYCDFTLIIEEHQTFASYNLTADRSDRQTAGRTYFINETGFYPAVEGIDTCDLPSALYASNFTSINCSVPMTVDGVTYRRFIAINGLIPGPTLIVREKQTVIVRVQNKLASEAITIHWHGMYQRGTPWMDGVGFISQYPILAGEYFDYIFEAYPAGTHWYHSHVGAQRTDGLFGALVVREVTNNFSTVVVPKITSGKSYTSVNDVPSEHTLTLLDWQREASLDLFVKIHSSLRFHLNEKIDQVPTTRDRLYNPTVSQDKVEVGPVPYWTGLINGLGRNVSSYIAPLSIFKVSQNAAYRFRVIGAQSLYAYSLSIDNHKLTVIATDGHFIEPVTVEYLIVHSGERYDFVIDTYGNRNQNNFWIRAETLETNIPPTGRNHSALAVLMYNAPEEVDWTNLAIDSEPHSCTDMPCKVLNCPFAEFPSNERTCAGMHLHQLTSLFPEEDDEKLPKIEDDGSEYFFNFGFDGRSFTSAVNGKNFLLPVVPPQTSCSGIIDGCEQCMDSNEECVCTNVVKIPKDQALSSPSNPKSVVMVFSAVGTQFNFSHPIHLHGHSFFVVHVGHGVYDQDRELINVSQAINCSDRFCRMPKWAMNTMPPEVMNAVSGTENRIKNNFTRKDTVIVLAGGYVVVAFLADNPGYWFLHCHIEVHQLEGMGVLIEEYDYKQQYEPPDNIDSPGHFDWTYDQYKEFTGMARTCLTKSESTTVTPSSGAPVIGGCLVMFVFILWTIILAL